jgi:RNA polymerase sigma-70 factor (ECF subfamily)
MRTGTALVSSLSRRRPPAGPETSGPTRRSLRPPDDDRSVSSQPDRPPDRGAALLDLYDRALPQVYGYLLARCSSAPLAEDLTAETFLAAVAAARSRPAPSPSVGWLIGIARHKLVDHWRRQSREERTLSLAYEAPAAPEDPWDAELDAIRARDVLAGLGAHHRVALTLRYLDGLPVPEVAAHLGRSTHATEALLVRARGAFRRRYEGVGDA